ncbi:hypothetical protein ACHFJ0_05155 [Paracoccus sp. NGMCC 1.201697]|uniref:Uncharacterized protein n=1 Tax=Paracoccus broussonetiae subsp. drimophilus TaxID=3373869 RepID=A0ABW7LH02_9RHOB
MSILLQALTPVILEVTATVATVAITAASGYAMRKWGIEIQEKHRNALHSALMSGIEAALGRGFTGDAAVADAIEHARRSVPDALKNLKPAADVLTNLAKAKLEQATKVPAGDALAAALKQAGAK